MSRIVCKFGGTSLADANQFRKVRAIVESDPRRSIVVPSAPGKRVPSDAKLTDLLYLCQDSAAVGADFSAPFAQVRERFLEIERDLGLSAGMSEHLDKLASDLKKGVTRDHVASRGEYLNGLLMAAYLDAEFVEPADSIVITANGGVDPETYLRSASASPTPSKRYVVPGFYGRDTKGNVKTFSRGGSDISGAIVARAAKAELYENWTDVSGLLMSRPAHRQERQADGRGHLRGDPRALVHGRFGAARRGDLAGARGGHPDQHPQHQRARPSRARASSPSSATRSRRAPRSPASRARRTSR